MLVNYSFLLALLAGVPLSGLIAQQFQREQGGGNRLGNEQVNGPSE
jgi:hypothetical protein